MNMTIRSGSGKFTGLRRTVLMREKIAVLAPTPRASARIAVMVNAGRARTSGSNASGLAEKIPLASSSLAP
jgi:hypothetical protein